MTLRLTTQSQLDSQKSQIEKCNEINRTLKAKVASLTADLECCKIQLTNFEIKEKREQGFEVAFQKAYVKEQDLQHQIRELVASKNNLISQIEQKKLEFKQ